MTEIIAGIDTIGDLLDAAFGLITGNPLLVVYAGAGLLALGFVFFRKGKSVAR